MSTKPETKDIPRTDSAVHNPFSAFDPMATWAATQQAWQKVMSDSLTRAQGWSEEYAALEAQMFARMRTAIDTWAQLARDTIGYGEHLALQARKMSFEAVRKAGVGA